MNPRTVPQNRWKLAAIIIVAILCLPVTVAILLASMKEGR